MRLFRRNRCPHSHLRGIYGDEIIFATPDFNRLQCLDCGRHLKGPVVIAEFRQDEATRLAEWRDMAAIANWPTPEETT